MESKHTRINPNECKLEKLVWKIQKCLLFGWNTDQLQIIFNHFSEKVCITDKNYFHRQNCYHWNPLTPMPIKNSFSSPFYQFKFQSSFTHSNTKPNLQSLSAIWKFLFSKTGSEKMKLFDVLNTTLILFLKLMDPYLHLFSIIFYKGVS